MFVGVRCFEPPDGHTKTFIHPVVKLAAQIKLAPIAISYGIMPANSILNGALIIRMNDQYWAMRSPREKAEYLHN